MTIADAINTLKLLSVDCALKCVQVSINFIYRRQIMLVRCNNGYFAVFSACILLSACAGGGSSSSSGATSGFSAWSAVTPNSAISLSGSSTSVTGLGSGSTSSYGASGNFTFDNGRNFTAVSMTSGTGAGATFNANAGDQFYQGIGNGTIFAVNKQGVGAVITNPYDAAFEYQTFGAWGAYASGPQPSNANAVSLGSATSVTGMPSTGSVTFNGFSAGLYYQGAAGYFTAANMSAGVDFAARTIAFNTTNTVVTGALLVQQVFHHPR